MLEQRTLDKSTPIPLYYQLKTIILDEISQGSYPVGSMIPTENELCDMFNVSRTTVRQAVMELVQEGKLYRIKSKGTLVAKPKVVPQVVNPLMQYDERIRSLGRVPSTIVLDLKIISMPPCLIEIGAGSKDDKAVFLYRKRLADGEPIMRVKSYFPYDKCSFLMDVDFSKTAIHEALNTREETHIRRVSRTIEAIAAGSEDVTVLDMEPGSPVQLITNIRYNSRNEPIDCSFAYYRGDQNKFCLEIVEEPQRD